MPCPTSPSRRPSATRGSSVLVHVHVHVRVSERGEPPCVGDDLTVDGMAPVLFALPSSLARTRGVVAVVVEAGGLDAANSAVSLPGHSCVMRAVEAAVVDHFYGGAMIKDVVRACVASDTIADIRAFMQQHSAEFDQSSLDGGTEHRLEYTIIHSDYCRLIESHLSAALERHGKTLQAFDGL
eukprot:scaffold3035_cov72-Phaeocystis_antarctica.AAC.2